MTDGPLPAELLQSVSALARALVTSARSYLLYPPDHPAVRTSAARLRDALIDACAGRILSPGVTPDTLRNEGTPFPAEGAIAEAADYHAGHPTSIASSGSPVALDRLADSVPFAETIDMLGELGEPDAARVGSLCDAIGPPAVDQLRRLIDVEDLTTESLRAAAIVRRFGGRGVKRLGTLVASDHWYTRVHAAELLGEIGAAPVDAPALLNTWESDGHGEFPAAVVEAVDPDAVRLDPLRYM